MAEEFNLSIYNDVYDMSFNQDTEEIHIELKEGYYPLSNNVDVSNYYNKPQSDARYKPISYTPTWSEVSGKPTTFAPLAHTHTISEVINLQSTLANKVDKVTGKQLSTEDYTTSEKNKLAGIQSGAEVNVNADWNAISGDAHILNKPSTFTPSAHTHPISQVDNLQTTLDGKESTISAGTTGQYWRGDKTWQTLNKSAVGLSNVDNTSDANKPISNATQTALNNKQDVLTEDNVGSFMDLELSTKSAPTSGDTVLARDILTNKAVEIPIESLGGGGSGLALGETSSTAYRGDRGKIAYDHSQATGSNPHGTELGQLSDVSGTANSIVDTDEILKKESGGLWRKLSWSNIKVTLKAYFDNIYAPKAFNVKVTTPSSYVTGTTSETEVLRIEIPANSISNNSFLNIPILFISKIGTNGNMSIRGKLSTSPTMPSGTTDMIFGFTNLGATNITLGMDRIYIISDGLIKGFPFILSPVSSSASGTVSFASKPFDRTVTNYLYVSILLGNTADQARLEGLQLTNS